MRWKLPFKADHKEGDKRVVKRYALFPHELDDHYRVWLEPYYVQQSYWIFKRKGRWLDQQTWSEGTEKRKFLNSIKDSESYVQDTMDASYTKAKQAAAKALK